MLQTPLASLAIFSLLPTSIQSPKNEAFLGLWRLQTKRDGVVRMDFRRDNAIRLGAESSANKESGGQAERVHDGIKAFLQEMENEISRLDGATPATQACRINQVFCMNLRGFCPDGNSLDGAGFAGSGSGIRAAILRASRVHHKISRAAKAGDRVLAERGRSPAYNRMGVQPIGLSSPELQDSETNKIYVFNSFQFDRPIHSGFGKARGRHGV